jgi:NAD(P)H-hydrate repair Nnr-like enzyme with NAD(P)H-hydrate dehydratase domain
MRGTPALIAAAACVAEVCGIGMPRVLLIGDIGTGKGSAKLYEHFAKTARECQDHLIVFHYLQPDLDWHNKIMMELEDLPKKPCLVADAGYMYVAKMSGFASFYDLFTPDVGEMAFLADESAPHPFYTRGFLLHDEQEVPNLITRAYQHQNAARYLIVKGQCDYLASSKGILKTICEPSEPNMEPIGGTGDTLTGIVAGLLAAGKEMESAAEIAARANRRMGAICRPSPASTVSDLLQVLPQALEMEMS